VLTNHYLKETDEQLRQKSNRTYQRILAGLPTTVASRYGNVEVASTLEMKLAAAVAGKDWPLAAAFTAQFAKQDQRPDDPRFAAQGDKAHSTATF
jgi:hypothetical protein